VRNASEVAEFYQQLALLVRAGMPLPESLRNLAREAATPQFGRALEAAARGTERGESTAEALRPHVRYFDPFHLQLIAAGEQSGTLPEVLLAVARSARFAQLMTARIRETLAYPALTIHLGLAVFAAVVWFVMPSFREVFEDLSWGLQLPLFTRGLLGFSALLHAHPLPFLILYAALVAFTFWCCAPVSASRRLLLRVTDLLPGSCRLLRSADAARFCEMTAVLLRQAEPLPRALRVCGRLVENRSLTAALERAAERVEAGGSAAAALDAEPSVDRLIALTFQHTPEAELSEELARLAELFEQRTALAARSAAIAWSVFALILMAFVVGFVVIALFQPLVSVVSQLGM